MIHTGAIFYLLKSLSYYAYIICINKLKTNTTEHFKTEISISPTFPKHVKIQKRKAIFLNLTQLMSLQQYC